MSEEDSALLARPLTLRGLAPGDERDLMLGSLQANILQAHVRTHLRLVALRIEAPYAARRGLADVARSLKTAAGHAAELSEYRSSGQPGTPYVGVALSATGYERLRVPLEQWPADPAFREGVARRDLGDPAPRRWEAPYQHGIDALVLVGSHDEQEAESALREVLAELGRSVSVLAEEAGRTLTNANGDGIEHFGYSDGRSQPLFVEEDAERERRAGGTDRWNPLVSLEHVLVPDAGTDEPHCYGSYLVYRKIEQDVRAFREQEARVAARLDLDGEEAERAGAMLVGRFEDGTPIALAAAQRPGGPIPNDFTFADDPDGARCPYAAHVRRMNDRPPEGAPRIVLARRGQSYGIRADNPNDRDISTKPRGGVGLLFLAVMAQIGAQFEALQSAANGDDGGPFDAVAGQWRDPATRPTIELRPDWGDAHEAARPVDLAPVVRFRGGEYLFLPSLPFLRSLADG